LLTGIAVTIGVIGEVYLLGHVDFGQASHFRFNPGDLADCDLEILTGPRRLVHGE
jgi:hypothetical protein